MLREVDATCTRKGTTYDHPGQCRVGVNFSQLGDNEEGERRGHRVRGDSPPIFAMGYRTEVDDEVQVVGELHRCHQQEHLHGFSL